MTTKTIMDKVIENKKEEEKTSLIQNELKSFSNNLNQSQKKLVKDQEELISIASDSEVKSQTTNLEIAYNFSNKMRDFLPLKNMTTDDIRNFKDVEFNNALLKKFTNVVLCQTMNKNWDTIQANDEYYYNVLRRVAICVVFDLKYQVIRHVDKNAFSDPVGRRPKQLYISMTMVNKNDDLKKKYNPKGEPFKYVGFEEYTSIAKQFILGESDNSKEYTSKLVKLLRALDDYTGEAINFDTISTEIKKEEIELVKTLSCRFMSMLDNDHQFNTIADIKLFTDDDKEANGLINFHKYYDKKKYQAVSFVNVQNKLPLKASYGEQLLKQLKA